MGKIIPHSGDDVAPRRRRVPQTWPTYQEYKDWWVREVHLGRRRMPTASEIRAKYTRLIQLRGGTISDEDQRKMEHEYTESFGGIDRSSNASWRNRSFDTDTVLVHLDGDPNNNDMSNLVRMSATAAREFTKPEATGFTIAEAMQMSLKVALVRFTQNGDNYEYLVPGDTTVSEWVPLFGVVTRATGKLDELGHFSFVQVIEVKDLLDAEYDGKLSHVVTLFTAEQYNARVEKQNKRNRLLRQANKIAEDQHTLEKLTKLIGDSEEGKKLLAQIAELDNE